MFVSIESGLVFSLITKSNLIFNLFYNCFNIDELYNKYILEKVNSENKKIKHDFLKRIAETGTEETEL